MNEKDALNKSQTDWARLVAMRDDEIDFSDIPALTEEQLQAMQPTAELIPALKKQPIYPYPRKRISPDCSVD
jgi:hypothetical protein